MKAYKSIDGPATAPNEPCHVFVKYDGSNLRSEWSEKRGWYKWGTRNRTTPITEPIYGEGYNLFLEKYGSGLEQIFRQKKIPNALVYFEFFGSKTFAGMHKPDDPKSVVLFDVNVHKKGILDPEEFLFLFGHLKVAELLETSQMGDGLVEAIRTGTIGCESEYEIRNEIPEGVICKGGKGHSLWMAKIKTHKYLQELKNCFQNDWEKYY